jgi:hypothetical protein
MSGPRRFRAPTGNGEVLADPPFSEVPRLVEENRRRLDRADVVVGGLPLRELRALARREALGLTEQGSGRERQAPTDAPLILAGHQPELSHPGVWVKHFALNGLARRVGGVPLNLTVDNDTLKSAALRVPHLSESDPKATVEAIPFDRFENEIPYGERTILDPECFHTFPARVSAVADGWGFEPLLPRVWPDAAGGTIGEFFAEMRVRAENRWGCRNHELTVSTLFWSEAYARFVCHLLTDLPRFTAVYNRTIEDYRRANGVRSANHPAPLLDVRREDVEAPFWMTWHGQARRSRFYVRRDGDQLQFTNGSHISADPDRFVREWPGFSESGTHVYPRALTLTLFARVCLGDFFIHGIGGGKYDEVTDDIIRNYFGVEPPAYQVLSATLHLPLPGFPASGADVARRERLVRDLHWNPQRHLTESAANRPEVRALLKEKEQLAATEPPYADHPARREWFRRLQRVTERLRPLVGEQVGPAEAGLERMREEAAANAVLRRRDYSWVLYPEATLRPFLQRFLDV